MSFRISGPGSYAPVSSESDPPHNGRPDTPYERLREPLVHSRQGSTQDSRMSNAMSYVEAVADEAFGLRASDDAYENLSMKAPAKQAVTTIISSSDHRSVTSVRDDQKSTLSKFGPKPEMWNSPWLQTSVLLTFLGAFVIMLAVTATLYGISVSDNGLDNQVQSHHYAWTYGPTALLTVVLSLWRNVDFASRRLAPWQELTKGPSTARKTLMLDYLSPMLPAYLLEAMRNRHWAVVASTFGTLLLKLTIVVSTGLIVLEPTLMSKNGNPFSLTTKFDATAFDLNNVTGTPGGIYYGIQTQNLPYPKGTGPNSTVQEFQPQVPLPLDTVYSAEVEGFKSELDCEIVQIDNSTLKETSLPWYSILATYFVADIKVGNCSLYNVTLAGTADHEYHTDPYATQNFQGRITNVTCSDGQDLSVPPYGLLDHSTYPDQRILMTMADLRWVIASGDVGVHSQDRDSIWWVQDVSAVLCRPSYTLGKYQVDFPVTANTSGDPVHAIPSNNETTPLPGITVSQMNYAILTSLYRMYIGAGGADYVLATVVPNFFQILGAVNNGSRQGAFMDPEVLRDVGSNVWNGVAAQIVQDNMMLPTHDVVVGSVQYSESRLQVKLLSVILMTVTFALLCCVTVVLMMSRPWNVISRNPFSISAMATLLAANPSITKLFAGLGAGRTSNIRKTLDEHSFSSRSITDPGRSFKIEALHEPSSEKPRSTTTTTKIKPVFAWWHPLPSKKWFLCLAVALPLTIVAVLEVLQRTSDDQQGLATVKPNGTINSRIVASYLPALLMLVVAALFSNIQNAAATFAPYAKLKQGNALPSSITTDLVGRMPLHALLLSAKMLNLGLSFSILAVLVAGFLSIVVSGLYTTVLIPGRSNTTLVQTDRFDFMRGALSASDNDAGAITNLIEWEGLSPPEWTYNDLAFNKFELPGNINRTGVISVELPAYRAKLDCEVPMNKTVGVRILEKTSGYGQYTQYDELTLFQVESTLPIPCVHNPTNSTMATWLQHFYTPDDYTTNYIGQASVLNWSLNDDNSNNSTSGSSISGDGAVFGDSMSGITDITAQDIDIGGYSCPSFGITVGSASLHKRIEGNTTYISVAPNLTRIMCFQRLEQVQTKVTLNLPDLSINTTLPPIPDESTSTTIHDADLSSDVWEWSINTLLTSLGNGTMKSNDAVPAPPGGRPALNYLDGFIDTLVAGKDGVPITDLVDHKNSSRTALINASQRLYGDYMAQAFSANMRNKTAVPKTTFPAQILDIPRWRLVQNRAPKIALQAMLSFLAASAIATYVLLDMREVLPHNPSSIAGVASLLADSKLATRDIIPEGAEWVSDKDLSVVFAGLKFYLGWEKELGVQGEEKRFGIFIEN